MSNYQQDPTQNPKSREYKGPRAKLKDLLPYLADHRKALTLALILSVVASALSLAQPLLMGQVIAADLPRAAQLRPGDTVCFSETTLAEAHRLLRHQHNMLATIQQGINHTLGLAEKAE